MNESGHDVEQLEKLKLKAEIDELWRPFWKRHDFWIRVITLILAGLGIFGTYKSGFFDIKNDLLQIERLKLSMDIENFEIQKGTLIEENASLIADRALLSDSLILVTELILTANSSLTSLHRQRVELLSQIGGLKSEVEALKHKTDSLEKLSQFFMDAADRATEQLTRTVETEAGVQQGMSMWYGINIRHVLKECKDVIRKQGNSEDLICELNNRLIAYLESIRKYDVVGPGIIPDLKRENASSACTNK